MCIFVFISDLGMGEQHGGRPLIITVRSCQFASLTGWPSEERGLSTAVTPLANPIMVGMSYHGRIIF